MSVYDDVLTAVIDLAEQTELYSKIVIGPMPPENGISIAWGSGNLNTFLDKKAAVSMSAVLNCKNSDQELDFFYFYFLHLGKKKCFAIHW